MSVLLETSAGDIVIDLLCEEAPKACENFIKLSKVKYYNNCLFFDVQKHHIAISGDPSNGKRNETSIFSLVTKDPTKKYFKDQISQRKFDRKGLVATANLGPDLNTSAFFITLSDSEIPSYFKKHTIFGEVSEGLELIEKLSNIYVDDQNRPIQNIRIKHALVIDEGPFEDAEFDEKFIPSRSPSPARLSDGNIEDDVDLDKIVATMTEDQIIKQTEQHQTKSRA